ncbi:MAG: methionine adenosyltransferase [Patescibacteria group bacterium]|jgi:S-adenosylmethionine synthetase
MMNFVRISKNWLNPEDQEIEIVERKGLGHPDTLADGLAEAVSVAYSKYCLNNFGVVLHHNVDKLFIGGGWFKSDFGHCEFLKPVKVVVNGRMSNTMDGQAIDLAAIQNQAVSDYLQVHLPNLLPQHLEIINSTTQHTTRPFWFSPRDIGDLPEATKLMAGDTSVSVAHWPMTICETLAYELEHAFWSDKPFKHFIFNRVGQDIKVMVYRDGYGIDITVCMPVLAKDVLNRQEYNEIVREMELMLSEVASRKLMISDSACLAKVRVNPGPDGYRLYMLGIGSCVECGEEGLVGRGNSPLGVISTFRPYSMEAPAGKNPVYHTGRVMGFLTQRLAKAIFDELGVRCSVVSLAKNGQSLIPPAQLMIYVDRDVARETIEDVVARNFLQVDYLREILEARVII